MCKCKLCQVNDADKTGSHIVPDFLLKRVVSADEKQRRDYDLSFTLKKTGMTPHFGRNVSPEKLEETFGEYTEEDISQNKNNSVVDNYFCSKCEKRFAVVEEEYSKTLNKTGNEEYESGVSTEIGLLFWGSIIWRMSINGENGVRLTKTEEDMLRKMLDGFLPDKSIDEIDTDSFQKQNENMSYKLLRCSYRENEDKCLVFHPELINPRCLFIDDFILAYSINGNYADLDNSDSMQINELIKNAQTNKITKQEIITPYSKEVYENTISNIKFIVCKQFYKCLNTYLDCIHIEAGGIGEKMSDAIKKEIFDELRSEKPKGRKFTKKDINNSILKVMNKYKK